MAACAGSKIWLSTSLALREGQEADDGSRTRDLELGKLALYQLSYVRVSA
jgi:hypothetical protein